MDAIHQAQLLACLKKWKRLVKMEEAAASPERTRVSRRTPIKSDPGRDTMSDPGRQREAVVDLTETPEEYE
jgi:hypothetical protein